MGKISSLPLTWMARLVGLCGEDYSEREISVKEEKVVAKQLCPLLS